MRLFGTCSLLSSLGFALIGLTLQAGEQLIMVTPQSPAPWSGPGAPSGSTSGQTRFTLSAGGQIARTFPARILSVHLTTQPVFGVESDEWPVLELGSTSLVFVREDSIGRLVIVMGEAIPVALPFDIPLDPTGRSIEELTILLEQMEDSMLIVMSNQSKRQPLVTSIKVPLSIVASAGASSEWEFDQLAVAVSTPDIDTSSNTQTTNKITDWSSSGSNFAHRAQTTIQLGNTTGHLPAPYDLKKAASGAGNHGSTALEVFTPPSVRHGRADGVRAALANSKKS